MHLPLTCNVLTVLNIFCAIALRYHRGRRLCMSGRRSSRNSYHSSANRRGRRLQDVLSRVSLLTWATGDMRARRLAHRHLPSAHSRCSAIPDTSSASRASGLAISRGCRRKVRALCRTCLLLPPLSGAATLCCLPRVALPCCSIDRRRARAASACPRDISSGGVAAWRSMCGVVARCSACFSRSPACAQRHTAAACLPVCYSVDGISWLLSSLLRHSPGKRHLGCGAWFTGLLAGDRTLVARALVSRWKTRYPAGYRSCLCWQSAVS